MLYNATRLLKPIVKPICLLGLSHNHLTGNVILSRLKHNNNNLTFVEQEHSCIPCSDETKRTYACAVNAKRITISYEEYKDKLVDNKFDQIINHTPDYSVRERLLPLQRELEEHNSKKQYHAELKTNEQRIAHLRSQNYFVHDYSDDLNNELKYAVHFPLYRLFTTEREAVAINGLGLVRTNFHGKFFAVYKDNNIEEIDL